MTAFEDCPVLLALPPVVVTVGGPVVTSRTGGKSTDQVSVIWLPLTTAETGTGAVAEAAGANPSDSSAVRKKRRGGTERRGRHRGLLRVTASCCDCWTSVSTYTIVTQQSCVVKGGEKIICGSGPCGTPTARLLRRQTQPAPGTARRYGRETAPGWRCRRRTTGGARSALGHPPAPKQARPLE